MLRFVGILVACGLLAGCIDPKSDTNPDANAIPAPSAEESENGEEGASSSSAQLEAELDTSALEIGAGYIVDAQEASMAARGPFAEPVVGVWATQRLMLGPSSWKDPLTGRIYDDRIFEATFLRFYADGSYRTFSMVDSQFQGCSLDGVATEIGTYVHDATSQSVTMTPIRNKTTWTDTCPKKEEVYENRYLEPHTHALQATRVESASNKKKTAPALRFGKACLATRMIESCDKPSDSTYLFQRVK